MRLAHCETIDRLSTPAASGSARGATASLKRSAAGCAAIHLRPWPKLVALPELCAAWAAVSCRRATADRCLLYYNQPRRMPNFLALKYIVSTAGTSYRTFRAALTVLDAIAELKRTDAIVCDAANMRLSDRLMARLGWEPHKPQRWHRNFIRRFYGSIRRARAAAMLAEAASDASGLHATSDLVAAGSNCYAPPALHHAAADLATDVTRVWRCFHRISNRDRIRRRA